MAKDLAAHGAAPMESPTLLQQKAGVHVFRGRYQGRPAVAKYFEGEGDRREISNYRLLHHLGMETLAVYAAGQATLVLEDVDASPLYRLGKARDLQDEQMARFLAPWYFALHEGGEGADFLSHLYCEYDQVTEEAIHGLMAKLPEARPALHYVASRYDAFQRAVQSPAYTLTYNDFYWTNLIVRKDSGGAFPFDYNLLGRGLRQGDLRNVMSSLSPAAGEAFQQAYGSLYQKKHGKDRTLYAHLETQVDQVAGCVFALITAFAREAFPGWAEDSRAFATDGRLMAAARALMEE